MSTSNPFDRISRTREVAGQIVVENDTAYFIPSVQLVDGNGEPVNIAGSDRELVVTTYVVKTAFTGASIGDIITSTQIIDASSITPATIATIWRNQTTASDLASAPSSANITITGSSALTLAQAQSLGLATEVTLSAINGKLPTSLGQKAMSGSTSVTVASDQSAIPTDVRASASASAVTPSDSTNLSGTTRAIYVGNGGNIVAVIGGTAITFSNVQSGQILPIATTRINATNTTATGIVALF